MAQPYPGILSQYMGESPIQQVNSVIPHQPKGDEPWGPEMGVAPYRGGGGRGVFGQPRQPPQWERVENQVPNNHPIYKAGEAWSRGELTTRQFKDALSKNGYKADLRQRDSNGLEVQGPEGFRYLTF